MITTSRSDYAHLRCLLSDLVRHPRIELKVVALGPHLSPEFGQTASPLLNGEIGAVQTIECLLSSDTDIGMAKTLGVATLGLADALGNMRPDILLLIADRYEMLAPASVALTLRIPIAHIEGGEITLGAIDDSVRNAITKMAHLHFACTKMAQRRILAMGEEPSRVHWSGSLSLDDMRRSRIPSKSQIEKKLGVSFRKDVMVIVQHPVTMLDDPVCEARETFAALAEVDDQIVFVYPNADAGSRAVIRMAEDFVRAHSKSKLFVNLEHEIYLGLIRHAAVLLGNSSSGIIESTSLEVPTLNIGIRQHGREHAANVIDVLANRQSILKALARARSAEFRLRCRGLKNPYGDGHASKRIINVLANVPLDSHLLFKNFR